MADSINLMLDEMVDDIKWMIEKLEHLFGYNRDLYAIDNVKRIKKKYFGE